MVIDINSEVSWKYRKRSYRYQSEIMENWSKSDKHMESPSATEAAACMKYRCRVRPNPVCLRRLLTVAVFLLPWTLCSAAPWSLNQDTPAGNHTAIVNTRRRHHNHQKNNHSYHKHHHQHQHHKQSKDNDDKKKSKYEDKDKKTNYDEHIMKAATTNLPVFVSNLVAFSKDRPPTPPWAMREFDNLLEDGKKESQKDQWLSQKDSFYSQRDKRSAQAQQAVCDSVHSWIRKNTALDIYGNNITVMDKILTNGGEQVSQWFYETKCDPTGQTTTSCRGIDTQTWDSECLNKQSFVYAMVRTNAGEEGWNWIAINTACNCALRIRASRSMNRHDRRAPYPFVGLTETERR